MPAPLTSLLLLSVAFAPAALAEGSSSFPNASLETSTVLGVDVLDHTVEGITWQGTGSVTVLDPTGADRGPLAPGATFDADANGAWRLHLDSKQFGAWDVTVDGAADPTGRLFSEQWWLEGRSYDESAAYDGTLFIRAMGDGLDAVVAARFDGWAGYRWQFQANATGPVGAPSGGSVPSNEATAPPQHRIYLAPPVDAAHTVPAVELISATYAEDGYGGGTFTVETGTPGTVHVACDTSGDGANDPAGGGDLALAEEVEAGITEIDWDGLGPDGSEWEGGLVSCTVWLSSGEVHVLGVDIETAYAGLQLHAEEASGALSPVVMRWNDEAVADNAVEGPDGVIAPLASGPDGVLSGAADVAVTPGDGARTWGNFTENSRGNRAVLDTWTWMVAESIDLNASGQGTGGTDTDVPEDTGPVDDSGPDDTGPADDTDPPAEDTLAPGFYGGSCATAPVGTGLVALSLAGLLGLARRRR